MPHRYYSAKAAIPRRQAGVAKAAINLSRERPAVWVNPEDAYEDCSVSPTEMVSATRLAWEDITRGKRAVGAGKRPHAIITIGAPGSGKSTIAPALAAQRKGDYLSIDTDLAVNYHPHYRGMWIPSATTGELVSVGFTTDQVRCGEAISQVIDAILTYLLQKSPEKYNIILQSHWHPAIIDLKNAGYEVTLLFVGVPLDVAKKRARARAVETGRFLAPTLAAQDEVVEEMWTRYKQTAAWYGMWADEFYVARNVRVLKEPARAGAGALRRAKKIDLHDAHRGAGHCNWEEKVREADKAIEEACQ